MYGLRGFRNVQFENLKTLGVSLQQSQTIGSISDQVYYEAKDWALLVFSLGDPDWNSKGKYCFLSSYRDFPEDLNAVLPYVSGMHLNREPGMNIHEIQMKEGQILIPPLPQSMSSGTGWDSMFYAFIVRERDTTPDTKGRAHWNIAELMAEKYSRGSVTNIEMSGQPAMLSATMISSYYGKESYTYEIEDIPDSSLCNCRDRQWQLYYHNQSIYKEWQHHIHQTSKGLRQIRIIQAEVLLRLCSNQYSCRASIPEL